MNPILLCFLCGMAFLAGAIVVVFAALMWLLGWHNDKTKNVNEKLMAYWASKDRNDARSAAALERIAESFEVVETSVKNDAR